MLDVWLPGPDAPILLDRALHPALLRVVTDGDWLAAATDDLEGTSFAVIGAVEVMGPSTIQQVAASLERPDLDAPTTARRIVAVLRDHLLMHVSPDGVLRTWDQWADRSTATAAARLDVRAATDALTAACGPLPCLLPGTAR